MGSILSFCKQILTILTHCALMVQVALNVSGLYQPFMNWRHKVVACQVLESSVEVRRMTAGHKNKFIRLAFKKRMFCKQSSYLDCHESVSFLVKPQQIQCMC